MPQNADDRLLWIFIGTGLLTAYYYIPWQLRRFRKLTEINEKNILGYGDGPARGKTDDSLRINSLKTLALSPNYDQRVSAIKIIAERSSKDFTRQFILRDIAGDDPDARDKALVSLKFLHLSPLIIQRSANTISDRFCNYDTFKALIDCLVKFLPAHNVSSTSLGQPEPFISAVSPIHPARRPYHERTAITILNSLMYRDLPTALRCGVVSRWLSKYPFPCAEPGKPGNRQDVQELCDSWWEDDPIMAEIVRLISRNPAGRIQLRQHGLMGLGLRGGHTLEVDGDDDNTSSSGSSSDGDVRMEDGDDTAGLPPRWDQPLTPRPGTSHGQPRLRDGGAESVEEQNLRHRRREAIVISDGDGPLGRENIIEPSIERERSQARRANRGNEDITDGENNDTLPPSSPRTPQPTFMAFGPNNTIVVGEGIEDVLRESDQFVMGPLEVTDEGGVIADRGLTRNDSFPQEGEEESGGRPRRQSLSWVDWMRDRWRWGE